MARSGTPGSNDAFVDAPISSFEDLTAAIARCGSIVATRFHAVLISFLLRKPVLAIAYGPKTFDLLAGMGRGSTASTSSGSIPTRSPASSTRWKRIAKRS